MGIFGSLVQFLTNHSLLDYELHAGAPKITFRDYPFTAVHSGGLHAGAPKITFRDYPFTATIRVYYVVEY